MRYNLQLIILALLWNWQTTLARSNKALIQPRSHIQNKIITGDTFFSRKKHLSSSPPLTSSVHNNVDNDITTNLSTVPPRGGNIICDSAKTLLWKFALSAIAQTAALLGVLYIGKSTAPNLPHKLTLLSLTIPLTFDGIHFIEYLMFFIIIFASSLIGSIVDGGLSTATSQVLDPNVVPGDEDWYTKLKKPIWNPPGWLFPIMWLIISKPTQLVAVSKMWTLEESPRKSLGFVLYCCHLALGDTWNKVFFGYQCLGLGLVVILGFWSVLVGTAVQFGSLEERAGWFLVPTCLWVSVAACLNGSIYWLNRSNQD